MSISTDLFLSSLESCTINGQLGQLKRFANSTYNQNTRKRFKDYINRIIQIFDKKLLDLNTEDQVQLSTISRRILSLRNSLDTYFQVGKIERIYVSFYNNYMSLGGADKLCYIDKEIRYPSSQTQRVYDRIVDFSKLVSSCNEFIERLKNFKDELVFINNETPFHIGNFESCSDGVFISLDFTRDLLNQLSVDDFSFEEIIFLWTMVSFMSNNELMVGDRHAAICSLLENSENSALKRIAKIIITLNYLTFMANELLANYTYIENLVNNFILDSEQTCPLFARVFAHPMLVIRQALTVIIEAGGSCSVSFLHLNLETICEKLESISITPEGDRKSYKDLQSQYLIKLMIDNPFLNNNKKTKRLLVNCALSLNKSVEDWKSVYTRYGEQVYNDQLRDKDIFSLCFESLLENTPENIEYAHSLIKSLFTHSQNFLNNTDNQFDERARIQVVKSIQATLQLKNRKSNRDLFLESEENLERLESTEELKSVISTEGIPNEMMDDSDASLLRSKIYYEVGEYTLSSFIEVDSRVLRWYDNSFTNIDYCISIGSNNLRRDFSKLRQDHNFAWAMNNLLFRYGFVSEYYNERYDRYDTQYTLPIQIIPNNNSKKEIRIAVITVSSDDGKIYHRYCSPLSRSQGEDVDSLVDTYLDTHINYPKLGAKEKLSKSAFDSSAISGDGSVVSGDIRMGNAIFVLDPKNNCQYKVPLMCDNL